MRELRLGKTGPRVSVLGLGTMGVGGRYSRDANDDAAQIRIIQEGRDLGVTFFDTAEVYAEGHAEELLGQALSHTRETVTISTKFESANSNYENVIAACEASLARLGTDRIDIYQAHWPNPKIPTEETARALEQLWRDGKILNAGLSNTTAYEARMMRNLLPDEVPVIAMQQEYSLVERFVETDLLDLCQELDTTLVACSLMAQGRLAESEGLSGSAFETLAKLAVKNGMTPPGMALAWVAGHEGIIALTMTSRLEHLRANIAAVEMERTILDEDLAELSSAFVQPIIDVPVDKIDVVASHTGKVYRSLIEAMDNIHNFSPSPSELSESLRNVGMLKPVKLRPARDGDTYQLFEGQLRYWAWVIAHDGRKAIPAMVQNERVH